MHKFALQDRWLLQAWAEIQAIIMPVWTLPTIVHVEE